MGLARTPPPKLSSSAAPPAAGDPPSSALTQRQFTVSPHPDPQHGAIPQDLLDGIAPSSPVPPKRGLDPVQEQSASFAESQFRNAPSQQQHPSLYPDLARFSSPARGERPQNTGLGDALGDADSARGIFSKRPKVARSPPHGVATPSAPAGVATAEDQPQLASGGQGGSAARPPSSVLGSLPRQAISGQEARQPSRDQAANSKAPAAPGSEHAFLARLLFEQHHNAGPKARQSLPLSQRALTVIQRSSASAAGTPLQRSYSASGPSNLHAQSPNVPQSLPEAMDALGRARLAERDAKAAHLAETAGRAKAEKALAEAQAALSALESRASEAEAQLEAHAHSEAGLVKVVEEQYEELVAKSELAEELSETVTRLRKRERGLRLEMDLQAWHRRYEFSVGAGFDESEAGRQARAVEAEYKYDLASLKQKLAKAQFELEEEKGRRKADAQGREGAVAKVEVALEELAEVRRKSKLERLGLEERCKELEERCEEIAAELDKARAEKEELLLSKNKEKTRDSKDAEKKLKASERDKAKLESEASKLRSEVDSLKSKLAEAESSLVEALDTAATSANKSKSGDREEAEALKKEVEKWQKRGKAWADEREDLEAQIQELQVAQAAQPVFSTDRETTEGARQIAKTSKPRNATRLSLDADDHAEEAKARNNKGRRTRKTSVEPSVEVSRKSKGRSKTKPANQDEAGEEEEVEQEEAVEAGAAEDEEFQAAALPPPKPPRQRKKPKPEPTANSGVAPSKARNAQPATTSDTEDEAPPPPSRPSKDRAKPPKGARGTDGGAGAASKNAKGKEREVLEDKTNKKRASEAAEAGKSKRPIDDNEAEPDQGKKKRKLFGAKERKTNFHWGRDDANELGLPPELSPVKKVARGSSGGGPALGGNSSGAGNTLVGSTVRNSLVFGRRGSIFGK